MATSERTIEDTFPFTASANRDQTQDIIQYVLATKAIKKHLAGEEFKPEDVKFISQDASSIVLLSNGWYFRFNVLTDLTLTPLETSKYNQKNKNTRFCYKKGVGLRKYHLHHTTTTNVDPLAPDQAT